MNERPHEGRPAPGRPVIRRADGVWELLVWPERAGGYRCDACGRQRRVVASQPQIAQLCLWCLPQCPPTSC